MMGGMPELPEGVDVRVFDGGVLFRPDEGTDGRWWTWDELRAVVIDAHDWCVKNGPP